MALDAGAIEARMILNTRGWSRGVSRVLTDTKNITKGLNRMTEGARRFGRAAAIMGATAKVGMGLAIREAMRVEEAANLFEVTFKSMSDDVDEWSNNLASALGLNVERVKEQVSLFTNVAESMGLTSVASTELAKGMTKLIQDLSSFKDLSVEESFMKLRAGLVGSTEPLLHVGINVQEVVIQETAWRLGIVKTGKALTAQEKVVARYAAIMEQMQIMLGDAARNMDTATSQTRQLKSTFEAIVLAIGNALLPGYNKLIAAGNKYAATTFVWIKQNEELTATIIKVASGVASVTLALGVLGFAGPLVLAPLIGTFQVLHGAINVATWAVVRLYAAIAAPAATPVLAAIALITASIATIAASLFVMRALWVQNHNGIRDISLGTAHDITVFFDNMFLNIADFMKPLLTSFTGLMSDLWTEAKGFANKFIGSQAGIVSAVVSLWDTKGDIGAAMHAFNSSMAEDYVGAFIEANVKVADGVKDGISITTGHVLNEWPRKLEEGADELAKVLAPVWSTVVDQAKDDFDGLISYLEDKFPEAVGKIQALRESFDAAARVAGDARAIFEGYGDIDFAALLAGARGGGDTGKAGAAAAKKAASEAEKLRGIGEGLFEEIRPEIGIFREIEASIIALKAAGRFDEVEGILNPFFFKKYGKDAGVELDNIIAKMGEIDTLQGTTLEAGFTEEAAAADSEKLIEDGERLFESLGTSETILANMTAAVNSLKAAGRMDDEGVANLLAQDYFSVMEGKAEGDINKMIEHGQSLSTGFGAELVEIRTESDDTFKKMIDDIGGVGEEIANVGNALGSDLVTKIGAVFNAVGNMVSGLTTAVSGFKALQSVAKLAALEAAAAWASVTLGLSLVVTAILSVVTAFGLFGDETEEVKTGFDKLFEDLGDSVEQWGEDFTDTLVEFLKTGELNFKDFVNSILEDILRLTIQATITDPLISAIGSAFADGGVISRGKAVPFADGGVVGSPTLFPMQGGKMGLMGEAGPEAILPLERRSDGSLGIKASDAGKTQITIIDQRGEGAPPIERQTMQRNGYEEIRLVVKGVVEDVISGGDLDPVLGLGFGVERQGRARA